MLTNNRKSLIKTYASRKPIKYSNIPLESDIVCDCITYIANNHEDWTCEELEYFIEMIKCTTPYTKDE